MKTEDYPGDQEIRLTRKAILELVDSKDWEAVKLARKDLFSMLQAKEKWLSQ